MSHIAKQETAVTLKITGLRNSKGQIGISIFNNKDEFPETNKAVFKRFFLTPSNKAASTTLDLPSGDYAIAIMHDEDSDKEFDKSFLGIPQEGFGFSNNPEIKYKAPSFSECSFTVESVKKQLNIKMTYY